jgi:hypothetical protein
MKRCLFFLLPLLVLFACKEKEMTLGELKDASWSKLDKGVEYISLKKAKADPSDSIRITVKGFWGTNITVSADIYNDMQPELEKILRPMLGSSLKDSKHGYLKVNIFEMTSPEYPTGYIYLRHNDDSAELAKGIQMIGAIKGIKEVNYISKDMAKKKYLDDGNEDWKKVLDSNPLPASIEMKFDKKVITTDDYERIRSLIKDQMLYVGDISFPSDPFKKFEGNYYILEYNR